MQSTSNLVVVLGTGGTIAGTAAAPDEGVGYRAAQLGVDQLLQAVPMLAGQPLESDQLVQLDSKDMDHATWLLLARRVAHHLSRPEVKGIVVTHGTDTLEETAYFLHRVLAPAKPVVMTAAMRPATALSADGPQNLLDAVTVAHCDGAAGVVAVMGGTVFHAEDLRKVHTYQLAAFSSGEAGPVGLVQEGRLRVFRCWPVGNALGVDRLPADVTSWADVALVLSHAGVSGMLVDALIGTGVRGIVVAGTGNGTLHRELVPALQRAQLAGVTVWRASRCAEGAVIGDEGDFASAGALSALQARIELMLRLSVSGQG